MLPLDLHIVIGNLHIQVIGSKMLDVQVDCEFFPVRPHLQNIKTYTDNPQSSLKVNILSLDFNKML